MNNRKLLGIVSAILLVLFTVSTTATVIYARSAETKAKEAGETAKNVEQQLEALRITTQNKCIVRMVLSYPPPVPQAEFDVILKEYDTCIAEQEREIEEEQENIKEEQENISQ